MIIVWSRRAQRDLRKIKAYIARFDASAAASIQADVLAAVSRLEQFPQSGTQIRNSSARLLQVPGTVYAVPYRLRHGRLEIICVFDQRRNPDEML